MPTASTLLKSAAVCWQTGGAAVPLLAYGGALLFRDGDMAGGVSGAAVINFQAHVRVQDGHVPDLPGDRAVEGHLLAGRRRDGPATT
jgi:hypothetical protein